MEALLRLNDWEDIKGIFSMIGNSIDLLNYLEWTFQSIYMNLISPIKHFKKNESKINKKINLK